MQAPALWIGDPWRRNPRVVWMLAVEREPVPTILTVLGATGHDREWSVPVERATELRHLAAELETRWLAGSWEVVGLPADTFGAHHLAPLEVPRLADPVTTLGAQHWMDLADRARRLTEGACWICGFLFLLQMDEHGWRRIEPQPVAVADDRGIHAELRCRPCDEVERCVYDTTVDLDDAGDWLSRIRHLPGGEVRTALRQAREQGQAADE